MEKTTVCCWNSANIALVCGPFICTHVPCLNCLFFKCLSVVQNWLHCLRHTAVVLSSSCVSLILFISPNSDSNMKCVFVCHQLSLQTRTFVLCIEHLFSCCSITFTHTYVRSSSDSVCVCVCTRAEHQVAVMSHSFMGSLCHILIQLIKL